MTVQSELCVEGGPCSVRTFVCSKVNEEQRQMELENIHVYGCVDQTFHSP